MASWRSTKQVQLLLANVASKTFSFGADHTLEGSVIQKPLGCTISSTLSYSTAQIMDMTTAFVQKNIRDALQTPCGSRSKCQASVQMGQFWGDLDKDDVHGELLLLFLHECQAWWALFRLSADAQDVPVVHTLQQIPGIQAATLRYLLQLYLPVSLCIL